MRTCCSILILAPLLAGLLLVSPTSRAADDDANPTAGSSNDQIKTLITQLGDGEYARREDAARRLRAIGKPALPALKEALKSDDAEIASRAQTLIKRIDVRPVPGPNPAAGDGVLQRTRMRLSVVNGDKVIEVTEAGRQIKISEGAQGIKMTVSGLLDGKPDTEEFNASDAEQLKADNPEAYALYEQWSSGGPGLMFRGRIGGGGVQINGGQIQINGGGGGGGGAFILPQALPMPIVPDELDLLRARLDKQMRQNKLKDADRDAVNQAVEKLAQARGAGNLAGGMDKYSDQCDDLRKTLEQFKLDPGDLLPPPAKTRLGVSIAAEEKRLFVMKVAEKSRAERIGLKTGDQIRKVDGKEMTTVGELRQAVSAREKGLVVEITRDGDDLKLEEK
ncbi:MAG TPA: PDZ domain-containing protein [Tepidisphaeraceae bacterium]|jgi:hypothetical protein